MCSFCICLEFGSESTVMFVNNEDGNMKWKRYVWYFIFSLYVGECSNFICCCLPY